MTWQDRALCRGKTHLFFQDRPGPSIYGRARKICAQCPVTQECLELAMESEGLLGDELRYGMYGGMTPQEREALAKQKVMV